MSAELVLDQKTQTENKVFALDAKFTNNQQIDLVVADHEKHQAIFVTQSYHSNNSSENRLIDSVTVLKLDMVADGSLIW